MYRIYTWFDVTTTLCYPCYLFKYVYLHISRLHSFLNTPLPMLHTLKTSSGTPKKKSSVYPFNQAVIFPSRKPPQKYCIANCPTILYLDSKTTIYLNNHLSHSNNPHVPHTQNRRVIYHSQDGYGKYMRIQCLIVVHQSWMVKYSHRALEFSQSN